MIDKKFEHLEVFGKSDLQHSHKKEIFESCMKMFLHEILMSHKSHT